MHNDLYLPKYFFSYLIAIFFICEIGNFIGGGAMPDEILSSNFIEIVDPFINFLVLILLGRMLNRTNHSPLLKIFIFINFLCLILEFLHLIDLLIFTHGVIDGVINLIGMLCFIIVMLLRSIIIIKAIIILRNYTNSVRLTSKLPG
jgi:hypothetical protein